MSHRHWNISWVQASFILLYVISVQPCAKKKKRKSGVIALDALLIVKGHSGFRKGLCDVQKISGLGQGAGVLASGQKGCSLSFCLALSGSKSPVIQCLLLRAEQVISQQVVSNILNKNHFCWLFWFPKFISFGLSFQRVLVWSVEGKGVCWLTWLKLLSVSLSLITNMWCYPVLFKGKKLLFRKSCNFNKL